MSDLSRVELFGKKRKVLFKGNCLDLLPTCEAMCCREWNVFIPLAELEAHPYDVEELCRLSDKGCDKKIKTCLNISFRLKKKEDGSCIYLDENNRCSIYENRPRVCREFSCQNGWRLCHAFPLEERGEKKTPEAEDEKEKEQFLRKLGGDMVFVLHPLLKKHTVLISKKKGEILLIRQMVGGCIPISTKEAFRDSGLSGEQVSILIGLFEKKVPLKEIYELFCSRFEAGLAKEEFYELVWLLHKHSIILSSRNLPGIPGVAPGI